MPEAPVNFRTLVSRFVRSRHREGGQLRLHGLVLLLGRGGPLYAFYPAFKKFLHLRGIRASAKGGTADFAFTENWLQQFRAPEFQPRPDTGDHPPSLVTCRNHVNWSLRFLDKGAWGSRPDKLPHRVGHPIHQRTRAVNWGEEAETFMDEWSTIDIVDPRWPGEERFVRGKDGVCRLAAYGKVSVPSAAMGVAYASDPAISWQNMALHYQKRMLETFADGVYYDDYFLSPDYSPDGPGYVDDDGVVRPGVNIFAFRELTRRTAVMVHYRMGRRPLVFIHMTNANLVPLLSFATILLDHESRDRGDFKDRDCHERLYLDDDTGLLLAQEAPGLQSGCLSVWHNLFHGDERITRMPLGCCANARDQVRSLVRKAARSHDHDSGGFRLRVARLPRLALLGRGDARARRKAAPVKLLALARGGKALLVVTSYGGEGEVRPRSISACSACTRIPQAGHNAEPVNPLTGRRRDNTDSPCRAMTSACSSSSQASRPPG